MAGTFVDPPVNRRRPGGLFPLATVVTDTTAHEFYGGIEFQSDMCGLPSPVADRCLDVYLEILDTDGAVTLTLTGAPAGQYRLFIDGSGPLTTAGPDPTWVVNLAVDTEHTAFVLDSFGDRLAEATWTTADGSTTDTSNAAKSFEGIDWFHGDPFTIYKGIECGLAEWESFGPQARRKLDLGTPRSVEEHLWQSVLPGLAADITPAGGPVSPVVAVGLLEQYAADRYNGLPVIHAGYELAALMASQFVAFPFGEPGMLSTANGTPIANGAGYSGQFGPGGATGTWMYITGAVLVHLGEITVAQAPAYATNRFMALAERKAIVRPECLVAAIRVDMGAESA